jgi:hypothetical protein
VIENARRIIQRNPFDENFVHNESIYIIRVFEQSEELEMKPENETCFNYMKKKG